MNDVNVYPSRQSGEGVRKNTFRTYFLRSEEQVTSFYFAKILNSSTWTDATRKGLNLVLTVGNRSPLRLPKWTLTSFT